MNTPSSKYLTSESDADLDRPTEQSRRGEDLDRRRVPRTVIRGESSHTLTRYRKLKNGVSIPIDVPIPRAGVSETAALTDWLNITFPLSHTHEAVGTFFKEFNKVTGERFWSVIERPGGLHGWKRSYKLGETTAMFAIGGQNGTAFLSLPGEACALFTQQAWLDLTHLMNSKYQGKITRWDGAVDDFKGLHSVDWAVDQYEKGEFSTGGNKSTCCQHGNWICPDGRGRTFEVGRRKNGKMMRIYEKGKQLGDSNSPWVRWELELHSKDREIPWDVLTNIGGYVAGSYKVMKWIKDEASRIATIKKTTEISYNHLIGHASRAYGPLVNVMLDREDGHEAVIDLLRTNGFPKRLKMPDIPDENIKSQVSENE